ncbi:MAG: DUF5596 domain-containing protein [Clostridia bacterium]|nr:DUF5596 domain-containing protein [Clostridia bacterium]
MSRITNTMALIEFPQDASEYFEEALGKIQADEALEKELRELEKLYFEKFTCEELTARLQKLSENVGFHKFTIDMILFLCCCETLKKMYLEKGYSEEFFVHNMKDLTYKLKECKDTEGIYGTKTFQWYDGFFKMERFALGRLQYEHQPIDFDYRDVLKKGDDVINIHIPSSGPLLKEDVQESFKLAYEFFGPNYGDRIMLKCATWMLYPPTAKLLPEGSNIRKFYELFDVVLERAPADWHLWRIFGVEAQPEDYKSLPQNTSLQKIFYKYLNEGNRIGVGYGIVDYKPE